MTSMDAVTLPGGIGELMLRLLLSTALGGVIGLNRELRHKPAGLRTHALVSLGASLFALSGLFLTVREGVSDPAAVSRIVQGIVAGIGFVGGGVILRRDTLKEVQGLTTAASIWVVAAIGSATGLGLWRSSIAAVLLAMVILIVGGALDRLIHRQG